MSKPSALILVLLSIGIFYTFTSSQYGDAQALASQAAEYRDLVDNVSRIQEARDNLLNSYETIPAAEKDRLMKILPDNVDIVGLARDIDTIASKYGIAVKSVEIADESAARAGAIVVDDEVLPYDKAMISFSFISSYDNFIKFLADLERSLRIMDVKQASFITGTTALYEHKVTVETYWLR